MPVKPNDIAFGLDLFILTEVFMWIFIRFGFCMDFLIQFGLLIQS